MADVDERPSSASTSRTSSPRCGRCGPSWPNEATCPPHPPPWNSVSPTGSGYYPPAGSDPIHSTHTKLTYTASCHPPSARSSPTCTPPNTSAACTVTSPKHSACPPRPPSAATDSCPSLSATPNGPGASPGTSPPPTTWTHPQRP